MGARASRRRHEGRRIRKMRRQLGLVTRSFEEMADTMAAFGDAVMKAMSSVAEAAARFEVVDLGTPGLVAVRDRRDGTVAVGVDPGVPYPTQSGVEDGTEALSAAERVDAAAAEIGITLSPEQREYAIAAVAGIPMVWVGGRGYGKFSTRLVIDKARQSGPEANLGLVDEFQACENGCPDCADVTDRMVATVRTELEDGS